MVGDIQLHDSWKEPLRTIFETEEMQALRAFLHAERAAGKQIYPPANLWFNALDSTPLDAVKVVILGQDPYHGPGQAHGLCFSVTQGVRPPPSLKNIFKELEADLGLVPPDHGCLQHWADRGVLLLNSALTVEQGLAASHRGKGWEKLTDAVVELVARKDDPVVFMLWGSDAQRKAAFVNGVQDGGRHLVLRAPHPSPLSAHRGFLGCKHFSKANAFLEEAGRDPIDWSLPPRGVSL